MHSIRTSCLAVVCSLFVAAGCGGGDSPGSGGGGSGGGPTGSGGSPDGGGGSGAGGAPKGKMSIVVYESDVHGETRTDRPAGELEVEIDLPGGTHRTVKTDADGKVEVTGIDWSLGNAGISTFEDGRVAAAVADVGPDNFDTIAKGPHAGEGDVILFLAATAPPDAVTIDVTLEGKAAAGNYVNLAATDGSNAFSGPAAKASLLVDKDAPLTLMSQELVITANGRDLDASTVRWARFDLPAPKDTTAITLDLAAGGTTIDADEASVTLTVPGGDDGPFATFVPVVDVANLAATHASFGSLVTRHLSDDHASFAVAIEWARPFPGKPLTRYGLADAQGRASEVDVLGFPKDGDTVDGFLAPPVVTGPIALEKSISLAGVEKSAVTRITVYDAGVGIVNIDVPPNTPTAHLPTLGGALKQRITATSLAFVESFADPTVAPFRYNRIALNPGPFSVSTD